jgi:hypothetical protein
MLWVGWGALTGFHAPFVIGDFWSVGLPNGYELAFIDIDTEAYIYRSQDSSALVSHVTELARAGNRVYGIAGGETFVLDTASNRIERDVNSALFASHRLDANALVPVAQYPGRPRNTLDNIVLLALLTVPPVPIAAHIWKRRVSESGIKRAGMPDTNPAAARHG